MSEHLRRLIRQFRELTHLPVEFIEQGDVARIARGSEEALVKTLREALANIAKHARATRAAVRVEVRAHDVIFEVIDDGVGPPPGAGGSLLMSDSTHFGLRQMVERVESLGGRLEFDRGVPTGFVPARRPAPQVTAMAQIRISVADDHQVVRHGLRLSLELEPDMVIVGEASNGTEAIHVAGETQPDVMLLDVRLGDIDGPEVCRRVLVASPKTAVVMLTNYQQDELILRSLLAGAKGYVIKDVDLDELKKMIRSVYRGASVLDPKVTKQVISSAIRRNEAPRALDQLPGQPLTLLGDGPRHRPLSLRRPDQQGDRLARQSEPVHGQGSRREDV